MDRSGNLETQKRLARLFEVGPRLFFGGSPKRRTTPWRRPSMISAQIGPQTFPTKHDPSFLGKLKVVQGTKRPALKRHSNSHIHSHAA